MNDLGERENMEANKYTMVEQLIDKANAGDAKAALALGCGYEYGGGCYEKNISKALEWYRKAADQGNVSAQYKLGYIYYCGEIVEKDYSQAMYWFLKAAAQGNSEAKGWIAFMYRLGEGVTVDYKKAEAIYQEAIATCQVDSQKYNLMNDLGDLYATSLKDYSKAFHLFEQVAEQGIYEAKHKLAMMYRLGEGVAVDYNKAEQLYQEAIAICQSEAQEAKRTFQDEIDTSIYDTQKYELMNELGEMFAIDLKDYDKAFPLFKEAAEYGMLPAKFNLALCYVYGQGTAQDKEKALNLFRQTAAAGDSCSIENVKKLEYELYGHNQGNHPKSSGGCYIATAVYGSYDCPEVWTLRRYRDEILAKTIRGILFIKIYYTISPTLVKWFGKTKWFNAIWRSILDIKIKKLRTNGVKNTPYEDKEIFPEN